LSTKQRVRIIAGKWRSRLLTFPDVDGLRPTGDRIRETVFNWLAPTIGGARCLDLFSGSGALCFEALSRGARDCLALEQNSQALTALNQNRGLLDASALTIKRADTLAYLGNSPDQPFDIVFVDPPFQANLLTQVCALLEQNHWLKDGSLIYCELSSRHNQLLAPANWRVERSKSAGEVSYILYSRIEP
jgi:16S rRNA (guanine966-N2)-methyltransferase